MYKKIVCLFFLFLMLSPAGKVLAAVTWTDASSDHLWNTPANWDTGAPPTSADDVYLHTLPGPTVVQEGAVAQRVRVGRTAGDGALTVDGGTLDVAQYIDGGISGQDTGTMNGTINMISGTLTAGTNLNIGATSPCILNMTGGTIILQRELRIGREPTGVGHVNLNGGRILIHTALVMRMKTGAVGTMDITAGRLILDGDKTARVQGYIDQGWITAYQGDGMLNLDYDVTNAGQTTLSATHLLNPSPADSGKLLPGAVELRWTPRDPCVPGQPVPVDVYFTDDLEALQQFLDPAAICVVNQEAVSSVVVQTQPKKRYYWAVDCYVDGAAEPVLGPIFSFTADNLAPQVDAGTDIVTWLQDGVRTGSLTGTVSDNDTCAVQWTVVSEPAPGSAVLQAVSATETGVTLTATGRHVFQLEANDGEYTGSDTVTIDVFEDSCEAARSLADYQRLVGDLNEDCRVDDLDLTLLQEHWLEDNSLTTEWYPRP